MFTGNAQNDESPGTQRNTEGLARSSPPFGLVFWRFMLPEGPIEAPTAEVVPVAALGA